MSKPRIHIGHHFFGSGNLGDDLMLAGFLEAARPAFLEKMTLTCCTPHDADCQRRRFPEIEWRPYHAATREACIRRCDAWLGLGDTPFQATGGHTWFLDHLCEEAAWCRRHDKPMFYLGVGVNEREVVAFPQMPVLVGQAERIWMRDGDSVEMLGPLLVPGQATAHADLAHLALATMRFPPMEPETLGLVLNFEDAAQFRPDRLAALVRAAGTYRVRWLAQEVRPLPGSETVLHRQLPPEAQARAPLRKPDYAGAASARALLTAWEGLEALFVSRYHAALTGAWMGARVAVFARSDKVAGAARQLDLPTAPDMGDPAVILRAVREAQPVERARLQELVDRSRAACEDFFARVSVPRAQLRPLPVVPRPLANPSVQGHLSPPVPPFMSVQPPARILFLHPDAYGDLFLFEPVPRLIRDAWPQTEVAVLIRQTYADAVPLLASGGVRFLTTDCNPYREGPGEQPAALEALRATVRAFAPDCVVAACTEQTWLEAAVGTFLPEARQVSLGPGLLDPLARAALEAVLPVDWSALYPEKIALEPEGNEWEKNLRLAGALLGGEAPRWWPVAHVPPEARERAAAILSEHGLEAGEFVVCPAAGTANVQIKSWPAEHYGETLAFLEHERGIRALLIGHASERPHLEAVRAAARRNGAEPALWLGQDGEMPVTAGLLEAARFYFGNDTGALHLAAALGKAVVPVFGGGHWPRFQPVARRSLTIVQPLPCFGCAWDCYYADAPCVRTISLASVRRALEQFLQSDADGQVVFQAEGLDAGARALIDAATPRLRSQREDSVDRVRQAAQLTALLRVSESDRDARLRQVEHLDAALQSSETDREARQAQIQELAALLEASEADRDARGKQVELLVPLLKASETDRDARQAQIQELAALLKASEADRDARGKQVEELVPLLRISDADRQARQAQIEEITALLGASEADRDIRGRQVEQLAALLKASEADRDARGKQVEELVPLLRISDADRQARQAQIEEITALLGASEADRAARQIQIEKLTAWLRESETDRAARGKQVETLTGWLLESNAERATLGQHIEHLTAQLEARDTGGDPAGAAPAPIEPPTTILQTGPAEHDEEETPETKLTPALLSDTPTPALSGAILRHAAAKKSS